MTSANHFRPFIRALEHDRQLVLEMDKILDRAQRINIDFRDTARRRLQQRIQLLARNLEREGRALHGIDLYTAGDRERVHNLAIMLELLLTHARAQAFAFSPQLKGTSILDIDREPRLNILDTVARALDRSMAVADELAGILAQPPVRETVRRSPLRVSRRITNLAVRFLPWEKRQRYLHEYLSELHDLAQDENPSGRAQLAYALRLLVRTPALRFALRRRAESGLVTSRPEA